jgi:short subunit dehydrogenase-like uncharacterized protein
MAERRYDVVVFGATGFTGALTAEYLARNAPDGVRWALAGRNRQKLEDRRSQLGQNDLPLLSADVNDPESIRAVAERTRVVITTVGPYILYGEPLVAACATAGTDYVDLTGEPEFVDAMWIKYNRQAEQSGARIVHSCGFDSIPHDLGALYTVNQLPEGVPIRLEGYVRVGATFSGGTYHSTIHGMSRLRQSIQVARERRRLEPRPGGRRVRGVPGKPHHDAAAGGWVVPLPTIDPQTVVRSARALDRYGPDFSYSHYAVVKRLPVVAGIAAGAVTLTALAQIPPARRALLKLQDSGEGPSPEQRERSWFRVRFRGESDSGRVFTEVSGGDPGYSETSKMLAESALCLAYDQLPERSGQLTPAVAMGQALIDRLTRAGLEFRVHEGVQ